VRQCPGKEGAPAPSFVLLLVCTTAPRLQRGAHGLPYGIMLCIKIIDFIPQGERL